MLALTHKTAAVQVKKSVTLVTRALYKDPDPEDLCEALFVSRPTLAMHIFIAIMCVAFLKSSKLENKHGFPHSLQGNCFSSLSLECSVTVMIHYVESLVIFTRK